MANHVVKLILGYGIVTEPNTKENPYNGFPFETISAEECKN